MKYLIYIVAIDSDNHATKNSDYAQYSIKSWENWCKKNGVDLIVNRTHDERFKYPIWNKSKIGDFAENYDFVGMVDSDTMISIDAPNIFRQLNPDKFYGVNDLCDLNWLFSSIEARQHFFPTTQMNIFKYLNAGVLFFGRKYLEIFEKFLTFVLENQDEINGLVGGGKEQTLLNFFLQSNGAEIELLTPAWNLLSIHKKNMFINNWQLHPTKKSVVVGDETSYPYFMRYAHIWHFTGFPIEDRVRIMKTVWEITEKMK